MTAFPPELLRQAESLLALCRENELTLATAESCTGGLAAGLLTSIAGASVVFDRGFVTYSNAAKTEMLGIPPQLIAAFGAVSEDVARAMAVGALKNSQASITIAVTGVAGPGGGSPTKPVGRVHVASARRGGSTLHMVLDLGDIGRDAIRLKSVEEMLRLARAQAFGP